MRVRSKDGKLYDLLPGWTEQRFNVLKREAKDFAKVCCINIVDKDRYLIPIKDLEWIGG